MRRLVRIKYRHQRAVGQGEGVINIAGFGSLVGGAGNAAYAQLPGKFLNFLPVIFFCGIPVV